MKRDPEVIKAEQDAAVAAAYAKGQADALAAIPVGNEVNDAQVSWEERQAEVERQRDIREAHIEEQQNHYLQHLNPNPNPNPNPNWRTSRIITSSSSLILESESIRLRSIWTYLKDISSQGRVRPDVTECTCRRSLRAILTVVGFRSRPTAWRVQTSGSCAGISSIGIFVMSTGLSHTP